MRHVYQVGYLDRHAVHLHDRVANVPIEARDMDRLICQVRDQVHTLPQRVELRGVAFAEVLFEQSPIHTKNDRSVSSTRRKIGTVPNHIVFVFIAFLIRVHNAHRTEEILYTAQMRRDVMRERKRPIFMKKRQDEKLAQGAFGFVLYSVGMVSG